MDVKNKKLLLVLNVDWFLISHRLPIALEAIRRGYSVYVACTITDKKEYLESLGIKVLPINILTEKTNIFSEVKKLFQIWNIVKTVRPDIVHLINIRPMLYGGMVTRFFGIGKRVIAISGFGHIFLNKNLKTKILKFFISNLLRFVFGGTNTRIIVQNKEDLEQVKTIRNCEIFLIKGSGVDLEQYKYIPKDRNDEISVIFAARLIKEKGIFEFAKAAKILKPKYPNVNFIVYGDIYKYNPSSLNDKDLDELAAQNCLIFNGFCKDMPVILQKADIFVLPSYREGMPKALLEAAACGTAVVTTDSVGCRDAIIPNKTGLLCKLYDAKSLADCIEKLILDEKLRIDMGIAGRKFAEKEFDIRNVVKKHFEIYED